MRPGLESLNGSEVAVMTRLWRSQGRALSTSFSGTSMLPSIAPGETVVVGCGTEPAIGDVILYFVDKQPIVHRLVARSANWLMAWGDANPLPDLPVSPECVVGVIRDVPAAAPSLWRTALVRTVTRGTVSIAVLNSRMRRLYLLRTAWTMGPRLVLGKAWRKLIKN